MPGFDHEPASRFGRLVSWHAEPAATAYAASEPLTPGPDDSVAGAGRQRVHDSADLLLHAVADGEIVDESAAYLQRTPDSNPLTGWTDQPGLLLVASHSHWVQHATGIGHVVARVVLGDDPSERPAVISISRFDGYVDWR